MTSTPVLNQPSPSPVKNIKELSRDEEIYQLLQESISKDEAQSPPQLKHSEAFTPTAAEAEFGGEQKDMHMSPYEAHSQAIQDSEQKRMITVRSFSQDRDLSKDAQEPNLVFKRPATVTRGLQKRIPGYTNFVSHNRNESLSFNNEEADHLKEVFNYFDQQNTGFVKEEELIRILQNMNQVNDNVTQRIQEIKLADPVAKDHNKFTFLQFLKILGKVNVELNEDLLTTTGNKLESTLDRLHNMTSKFGVRKIIANNELQQSCNIGKTSSTLANRDFKSYHKLRNKTVGPAVKQRFLHKNDFKTK